MGLERPIRETTKRSTERIESQWFPPNHGRPYPHDTKRQQERDNTPSQNRTNSYYTTMPINKFTKQFPTEFLPRTWNEQIKVIKDAETFNEMQRIFKSQSFQKY